MYRYLDATHIRSVFIWFTLPLHTHLVFFVAFAIRVVSQGFFVLSLCICLPQVAISRIACTTAMGMFLLAFVMWVHHGGLHLFTRVLPGPCQGH